MINNLAILSVNFLVLFVCVRAVMLHRAGNGIITRQELRAKAIDAKG